MPDESEVEGLEEDLDPSVPTDLLELHVELEEAGVTPEEFAQLQGDIP